MSRLSVLILLVVVSVSGCDLLNRDSFNAQLATLSISSGSLSPSFSDTVYSYSVTVDVATDSITVTASPAHGRASVSINGQSADSTEVSLDYGPNTVNVVVTAENGVGKREYRIEIFRPIPTYSVGGSVSGLNGELTLQNNLADDLTLSADGDFTFATVLEDGSDYDVTVSAQPDGQECTVANGAGTLDGADVTDVTVTCVDLSFTVGGVLAGLNDGNSITLQNNGGDDLELTADGAFTFATEVENGADYDVTISVQPDGQECTVTNAGGTVDGANVSNVVVDCGALPVKLVAGTISGLVGTVTLQLNGSSDLLIAADGLFNFFDQFTGGESYEVAVITQPPNQTCSITNDSGTIGAGHVLDVTVTCTGEGVSTGSIFDWQWVSPLPQGNAIADFASDGAQLVAVGRAGLVQTSADGTTWTTRDAGTGDDLSSVAWGNGRYVAAGFLGSMLSSADGATWESYSIGYRYFQTVKWTGTQFVAVGGGWTSGSNYGPLYATSPDGVNWTFTQLAQEFTQLQDIAWNGSTFAAVSYPNIVWTSADGVAWNRAEIADASTYLWKIASDGNRFVMVSTSRRVFTSDDGIAWTEEAEEVPVTGFYNLTWDGSRFVAVGQSEIAVSADGSTWTAHPVTTAYQALSAVARFNGLTVVGAYDGATHTSNDDTTWATTQTRPITAGLHDVIWQGSQFVAVGDGPTAWTSPDGLSWTMRHNVPPYTGSMWAVVWGGGQFVAVGQGTSEQVLTSPDGITWTPHAIAGAPSLQGIDWGDNQYVAVGNDGTVWTSPDGTTWTDRSAAFAGNEYLTDVVWNGTVWVAAGYVFTDVGRGHVWTSPDGIDWTQQPLLDLPDWYYIEELAWNGSTFVAAASGFIGTSTDGINWSVLQSSTQPNDVYWSGSEFIVVGYGPDVLRSTDGSTWTTERAISGFHWGAASNGSTTILFGDGMTAKVPPPP